MFIVSTPTIPGHAVVQFAAPGIITAAALSEKEALALEQAIKVASARLENVAENRDANAVVGFGISHTFDGQYYHVLVWGTPVVIEPTPSGAIKV